MSLLASAPWAVRDPQDGMTHQHPRKPCKRCGVLREVRRNRRTTGLCYDCWSFVRADPVGWR
jgi:hypothetical protein